MKSRLMLLVVTLSMVGCVSAAQRYREAGLYSAKINEECRARRLAGELPGYEASAQCSNERIRRVWAESGYPYMDLVDLALAYKVALARRMDDGLLSEDDAKLLLAELGTRINSEEQQRAALSAQARSQALQSYGVLLQGLGAIQPRTPITCSQSLNTFICQ